MSTLIVRSRKADDPKIIYSVRKRRPSCRNSTSIPTGRFSYIISSLAFSLFHTEVADVSLSLSLALSFLSLSLFLRPLHVQHLILIAAFDAPIKASHKLLSRFRCRTENPTYLFDLQTSNPRIPMFTAYNLSRLSDFSYLAGARTLIKRAKSRASSR